MTIRPLPALTLIASLSVATPVLADNCEIKLPDLVELKPFDWVGKPPDGYEWRGTQEFAARVPVNGHWTGAGADRNFRDRFVWWLEGNQIYGKSSPRLEITATRLDAQTAQIVERQWAHSGEGWGKIIAGLGFSSAGCWAVTGRYKDQQLDFVFHVGDKN